MPQQRRSYQLKERARRQQETRRRIVEATVNLHREVGPSQTTVAEIARRAGVGRVTVYNHFPDEGSLLGACSALFIAHHPPPDPTTWQDVTDPPARLRAALGELYAYFRDNEAMIANVTRDAALLPALAEVLGAPEATAHEQAMRATLLAGRDLHGARHAQLQAALGLALAFPTWQRLTRHEELSDQAAVEVMAGAVEAV